MDRFYYDLLNIGKKKMDEPKYTKLLNRIIDEETNYMRIENPTLDRVCKVVSTNMNDRLKELNINSKIINTKELYDMYEHEFILSSFIDLDNNINYFIIDPSYSQFKNTNIEYTLNKTIEGKNLLNSLMCLGYSKIEDNDLKRYIGSLMCESDINKIDITISDLVLERRK